MIAIDTVNVWRREPHFGLERLLVCSWLKTHQCRKKRSFLRIRYIILTAGVVLLYGVSNALPCNDAKVVRMIATGCHGRTLQSSVSRTTLRSATGSLSWRLNASNAVVVEYHIYFRLALQRVTTSVSTLIFPTPRPAESHGVLRKCMILKDMAYTAGGESVIHSRVERCLSCVMKMYLSAGME